jgi:hypothetical protein
MNKRIVLAVGQRSPEQFQPFHFETVHTDLRILSWFLLELIFFTCSESNSAAWSDLMILIHTKKKFVILFQPASHWPPISWPYRPGYDQHVWPWRGRCHSTCSSCFWVGCSRRSEQRQEWGRDCDITIAKLIRSQSIKTHPDQHWPTLDWFRLGLNASAIRTEYVPFVLNTYLFIHDAIGVYGSAMVRIECDRDWYVFNTYSSNSVHTNPFTMCVCLF